MRKQYREFVRDRYPQGSAIPLWKGYVADSYATREVIVAPIPFNLVFSLAIFIYHASRFGMMGQIRFLNEQLEMRENRNEKS
jgi:hypothetical protein